MAGQTPYMLQGAPFEPVPLDKPSVMADQQVAFLVVLEKEVEQRYSFVSPDTIAWYAAHSDKVFSYTGPSYGEVAIYRTTDPLVW